MDERLYNPVRLPAEPRQLSRGALGERREVLAGLHAGNGEVARRARAPFNGRVHGQGTRVVGEWASDNPSLALSGDQLISSLACSSRPRSG